MKTRNRNTTRPRKPRLRIERLEPRIAPTCHYNVHGKTVGCGNPWLRD